MAGERATARFGRGQKVSAFHSSWRAPMRSIKQTDLNRSRPSFDSHSDVGNRVSRLKSAAGFTSSEAGHTDGGLSNASARGPWPFTFTAGCRQKSITCRAGGIFGNSQDGLCALIFFRLARRSQAGNRFGDHSLQSAVGQFLRPAVHGQKAEAGFCGPEESATQSACINAPGRSLAGVGVGEET